MGKYLFAMPAIAWLIPVLTSQDAAYQDRVTAPTSHAGPA
jgi:hypothetical protein